MFHLPINVVSVTSAYVPAYTDDCSLLPNSNIIELPPKELSLHLHTFWKIFYISSCDEFPVSINDVPLSFKENHIYLIPPHTLHTPSNQYSGAITNTSIKFYLSDKSLSDRLGSAPLCIPCSDAIKKSVLEITSVAKSNSFSINSLNEMVRGLLLTILSSKGIKRIESDYGAPPPHNFSGLVRYLYEHYKEEITRDDMAKFTYMGKAHFSRKFKSVFKITPTNYLYSLRLNISLELLTYSNASIAKIAEDVGFKKVASYCSAFRRMFNMSPSEYRRLAQAKDTNFPPAR